MAFANDAGTEIGATFRAAEQAAPSSGEAVLPHPFSSASASAWIPAFAAARIRPP